MQATGKESIVAGFYHEGYEEPLLMLMRRRGVHSGLVVKVYSLSFFTCHQTSVTSFHLKSFEPFHSVKVFFGNIYIYICREKKGHSQ